MTRCTINGMQITRCLFPGIGVDKGLRFDEDCINNDNCVLSLGRTVIKVCTWTFARHGSWNRAECHAAEQHFPLLLLLQLLLLLLVVVVVDPLSLSSSQYTLTSPSLPLAPADATFPCGQRLHCISHLRLISAKSCVLVSG